MPSSTRVQILLFSIAFLYVAGDALPPWHEFTAFGAAVGAAVTNAAVSIWRGVEPNEIAISMLYCMLAAEEAQARQHRAARGLEPQLQHHPRTR